MTDLPAAVQSALSTLKAGEPTGAIRTAGKWPLGDLGTEQRLESVWVITTHTQLWVIAADDKGHMAEATGDRGALRLERGWVTDTLHAGRFALPLRTGTRRAGTELVELWHTMPGRGPVVTQTPARRDLRRGRTAKSAVGVPGWACPELPAVPEATWLFGLETATTYSFGRLDGAPVSTPVWLLISDHHAVFVARIDEHTVAVRRVDGRLKERNTSTRSWLTDGKVEVAGPLWSSSERVLATRLTQGDPARRWAVLAEHHAEEGDAEKAVRTWKDAFRRGFGRDSWPGIARFAWTVSDNRRAQAALSYTLSEGILELKDRGAWCEPIERRERAIRRHHAAAAEFARSVGSEIDRLAIPGVPDSLPSPPADEIELWVHALGALGRWTDASAAARALSDGPRAMEVMAAVRHEGGSRNAAERWRTAAHAWKLADEPEAATRCLERAAEKGAEPADHWTLGAWRWQTDHRPAARQSWQSACAADPKGDLIPELDLDSAGWRGLAALAEGQEAPGAAVVAWRRALAISPTDLHAALSAARLYDGDPAEAASWLAEAARAAEDEEDAVGPEVAAVWLAVAERRENGDREAALRRALQADSLHKDTWTRVLDLADPTPMRAWWTHVASVVLGTDSDLEDPPSFELPDDVATLAPGPGWMDRLRSVLDDREPPSAASLVRGLDKLDKLSPDAADAIRELATSLKLEAPDARVYGGEAAWGVAAHASTPPVVLVGRDHLDEGERQLSTPELRFLAAVELAHIAAGHPALDEPGGVVGTSQSAYTAFGRFAGTAENVMELLVLVPGIDQAAKIQKVLKISRRVFSARTAMDRAGSLASPLLDRILPERVQETGLVRTTQDAAALQLRVHADRIALAATGDIRSATSALLKSTSTSPQDPSRGLAAILTDEEGDMSPHEVMRLAALISFAAVELPRL